MATKKKSEAKDVASKATKKKVAEPKVETTKVVCIDKHCPTHGHISLHGRVFEGTVVSDKMQRTVSVEWSRQLKVEKFDRFLMRRSRVKAHNPVCISAKVGDKVRIAECRPIAKTVNFIVMEVLQ